MLAQGLTPGVAPEPAEHQIRGELAAQFRQFAPVEAGQHNGAAGVPGGGGDQAVEQTGVRDLVTPAKRPNEPLDVAAVLADVLDGTTSLVDIKFDRRRDERESILGSLGDALFQVAVSPTG
jgi:hypothetical protein